MIFLAILSNYILIKSIEVVNLKQKLQITNFTKERDNEIDPKLEKQR